MSVVTRQALSGGQDEYATRLLGFLVPQMLVGFREMLDNAVAVCAASGESEKYLMTFQNYLAGVPGWSAAVVEAEGQRIRTASGCGYLEDLLTCVHVAHLKLLTSIRPGETSQEVHVDIPSFDAYVQRAYSAASRHLYKNTYLFQRDIAPLEYQKSMREVELLLQRGAMDALREGLPVESIIKSYLAERHESESLARASVHAEVAKAKVGEPQAKVEVAKPLVEVAKPLVEVDKPLVEVAKVEVAKVVEVAKPHVEVAKVEVEAAKVAEPQPQAAKVVAAEPTKGRISFSATDAVLDMGTNRESAVTVPKTDEALAARADARAAAEDEGLLSISTEPLVKTADLGIEVLA